MPPDGEPLWFGRGQDAQAPGAPPGSAQTIIIGYPDHYVQSTERHPMERLAADARRPRAGGGSIGVEMDNYWFSAAAYRDAPEAPAQRPLRRRHRPRQLAARRQEPAGTRLYARCRPHRLGDAPAHLRCDRARHAQMRPRRRDLRCRYPRRRGPWRRLSRHRAAAAVGIGCGGAPSHLGRQADEDRRRDLLRDRRLLQALPLPAVAHGVSRQADRDLPRRRKGRARGHGSRARGGAPGQYLRGYRQCLFRRPRPAGYRQGQPHRLPDRPFLSAGLGRTDDEPAPRRPHRTSPRHDLPLHDRPVDGGLGHGDHRSDRHHRERRPRIARQRPAPLFVKE